MSPDRMVTAVILTNAATFPDSLYKEKRMDIVLFVSTMKVTFLEHGLVY